MIKQALATSNFDKTILNGYATFLYVNNAHGILFTRKYMWQCNIYLYLSIYLYIYIYIYIFIFTGAGDGVWGSCNLPYLGGTIHGAGAKDLRNTGETLPM